MPPIIAKELLAGTSDEALAASLDSVAVAFITLSDFDVVTARLPPKQLMQVCDWLNAGRRFLSPETLFRSASAAVAKHGVRGAGWSAGLL